ncbi:hypothetical protein VNO77_37195 [Canavalia gladiata]|uniref:F-box domain-containing protein n=1 Tax=Canavalia gladiata TaxID=3824 RepID=A0AAN9PWL3_CANGL
MDGNSMSNTKGKIINHCKRNKRAIEGRDYISYLPHSVMLSIFSLLPVKELVVISLVSKQWENLVKMLFSMIPSTLVFDELETAGRTIRENAKILQSHCIQFPSMYKFCIRYSVVAGSKNFTQFVNRTLKLHHGSVIKKLCFNLCYDGFCNGKEKVDKWYHFALTNEVKELELNLSNALVIGHKKLTKAYELPLLHSVSMSLEYLDLTFCKLRASNIGAFGSLHTLYLKFVTVLYFSIEDLVTKCPMLKYLNFDQCSIPLNFMVCKKDIMIETLVMTKCYTQNGPMCPIDISAPELWVLTLEGYCLATVTNIKAPNIINVDIAINEGHTDSLQRQTLIKLLTGSKGCLRLSLDSWCIQVLSYGAYFLHQSPILFKEITHLKLQVGIERQELPGIAYLIRGCPFLESLTLDIEKSTEIHWGDLQRDFPIIFGFDMDHYWESQVSPFHCLRYHLREIIIYGIYGRSCEIKMLEFFLEKAEVLEDMSLGIPEESSEDEILQYLSACVKASPEVVISSI